VLCTSLADPAGPPRNIDAALAAAEQQTRATRTATTALAEQLEVTKALADAQRRSGPPGWLWFVVGVGVGGAAVGVGAWAASAGR